MGDLDDRTADVTYNLNTNTFDVIPLSGETVVRIEKNGILYTATINQRTILTLTEPFGNLKSVYVSESGVLKRVKKIFVKENGIWEKVKF